MSNNKRKRNNPREDDLTSTGETEDQILSTNLPRYETLDYSVPYIELTSQSASRLLHPNPVCLLSSINSNQQLNVMPISWLTPANNYGGVVFVIHKSRATTLNILNTKEFILSIPNSEQRDMILACGKLSGHKVNKFSGIVPELKKKIQEPSNEAEKSNFNLFSVFNDDDDDEEEEDEEVREKGENKEVNDVRNKEKTSDNLASVNVANHDILCPIANTVAYMKCNVLNHHEGADPGHWIIISQIIEAHVHPKYWDGKCFGQTSPTIPPILSFIGSQRFAFIVEENARS